MKTILFLCVMLISSVAWGQKHLPHDGNILPILDDDGKSFWYLILSDEVYFKHDTIFAKKPNVLGASDCISSLNLLSLWDAYRQECWNDSTKIVGWWEQDGGEKWFLSYETGKQFYSKGSEQVRWQHRAPDATEFIDVYLRKRLK